jgi:excisionase family DNA binding protein
MQRALISASEIAERLGIQHQTIYLWVRQKRIPFYRVGRLVKFDEAEVLTHFKSDADPQRAEEEHAEKRIVLSKGRTIGRRRAHGSNSSQTTEQATEQSERYRAMLMMVK